MSKERPQNIKYDFAGYEKHSCCKVMKDKNGKPYAVRNIFSARLSSRFVKNTLPPDTKIDEATLRKVRKRLINVQKEVLLKLAEAMKAANTNTITADMLTSRKKLTPEEKAARLMEKKKKALLMKAAALEQKAAALKKAAL